MVINFYGEACFKIQSGDFVLLTDPFSSSGDLGAGLTPPRFKASLILLTKTEKPLPYERKETPTIVGPGEYEIQGNEVIGVQLPSTDPSHLLTTYSLLLEDMRLGFLGHAVAAPDPDGLELLAGSDILFVPAGGAPFLSAEVAAKLVKQINPKIVVASLFKIPGLTRKTADAKAFCDELGQKQIPEEKLTIKKKDLPQAMQVKVLTV